MDLLTTLPDFPVEPYAHILSNLENAGLSVKALLLLDALEVAKRTGIPIAEVRRLTSNILHELHHDVGLAQTTRASHENTTSGQKDVSVKSSLEPCRTHRPPSLSFISTLDPTLDDLLAGGISTGYLTEIAGESSSGKTQVLLQLLLAVQLPPPHGLGKTALYVSTEADLATNRLSQLLDEHTHFSSLPTGIQRPSLDNVFGITLSDLETQDHILHYHIPAAIVRYNVGLVVIDSVTANYRVESSTTTVNGLLERAQELKKLGHLLRNLAVKHNIAIVVANQISDRLSQLDQSPWTEGHNYSGPHPAGPPSSQLLDPSQLAHSSLSRQSGTPRASSPLLRGQRENFVIPEPLKHSADTGTSLHNGIPRFQLRDMSSLLTFTYQQSFYTGWGDPYDYSPWKTPALGHVWANQLGCRIVLKLHNFPSLSNPGLPLKLNISPSAPASGQHQSEEGTKQLEKPGDNEDSSIPVSSLNHHLGKHQLSTQENHSAKQEDIDFKRAAFSGHENGNQSGKSESTAKYELFPLPRSGRQRTMQVIFCPWAPGQLTPRSKNGQGRPTAEARRGVCFTQQTDGVNFEILRSGIRGIPLSRDAEEKRVSDTVEAEPSDLDSLRPKIKPCIYIPAG
ncbi:DNA repair protein rhp57 [Ophidiomyces ophidiicola]|nr:DNA repair protein rhp57 [Ophidiomyces ophidiicola]KAI1964180.1 DNA repair protein rhp57 [Ophidiomyces ophidiicola]